MRGSCNFRTSRFRCLLRFTEPHWRTSWLPHGWRSSCGARWEPGGSQLRREVTHLDRDLRRVTERILSVPVVPAHPSVSVRPCSSGHGHPGLCRGPRSDTPSELDTQPSIDKSFGLFGLKKNLQRHLCVHTATGASTGGAQGPGGIRESANKTTGSAEILQLHCVSERFLQH
ncbi:hypothetical protein Q8A73_007228 [Channa argus]|nr:hypothetical protein Q8A73_007228 [Channa argus]